MKKMSAIKGFTKRTLIHRIKQGKLKAKKIDGIWYLPDEEAAKLEREVQITKEYVAIVNGFKEITYENVKQAILHGKIPAFKAKNKLYVSPKVAEILDTRPWYFRQYMSYCLKCRNRNIKPLEFQQFTSLLDTFIFIGNKLKLFWDYEPVTVYMPKRVRKEFSEILKGEVRR